MQNVTGSVAKASNVLHALVLKERDVLLNSQNQHYCEMGNINV